MQNHTLSTPSTSPHLFLCIITILFPSSSFFILLSFLFFLTLQNIHTYLYYYYYFYYLVCFTQKEKKRTFKYLFIIIHINFRYLKFFVIIIFGILIKVRGLICLFRLSHCSGCCERSCGFCCSCN